MDKSMGQALLLIMIFLPVFTAVEVIFLGSGNPRLVKRLSLGATIIMFALSVIICLNYQPSNMGDVAAIPGREFATASQPFQPDKQFTIDVPWLTFKAG